MNDVNQVLRAMVGVFDAMRLPYAVMGGVAVRAHGIPRPTYDVDFTLAVARDALPKLYETMHQHGFTVAESYLSGWIDQVAGMPLIKCRMYVEDHGVDVDVFLAESPFQDEVLRRSTITDVDGLLIRLVSPEDLILLKLIANRPRDLVDVSDILFTQGSLDEHYLRTWGGKLGIIDRLNKALQEHQQK